MSEHDLAMSETMQEMSAQIAALRTELDTLKQHARNLPEIESPVSNPSSKVSSTRRKTLKRLGLSLLGGAAAATISGFSTSEAKVTISSQSLGASTSKAGAIVIPPGAQPPSGSPYNNSQNYGLIASSLLTALDLTTLPHYGTGVYATGNENGVWGTGNTFGVLGTSNYTGVNGSGTSYGVYGSGITTGNGTGVYGTGQAAGVFIGRTGGGTGALKGNTTVGVLGSVGTNFDLSSIPDNYAVGVYGVGPSVGSNNYAGYFDGNVHLTGILTGGAKNFKIDHPLDPANKNLYHTSVESPDMMNLYTGLVTLDEQGEAVVEMPDWFEALNSDFRYQLTCLGQYAPVYIVEEIQARTFKIAGGVVGLKVSWQVTGIRQDAFAKAYRSPVEEEKPADDKGTYLHPELFGQPDNQSHELAVNPLPLQ